MDSKSTGVSRAGSNPVSTDLLLFFVSQRKVNADRNTREELGADQQSTTPQLIILFELCLVV